MKTHDPLKGGSLQDAASRNLVLDKTYTRTFSQNDSFIANIRRVLPTEIPQDVIDNSLAQSIEKEEYDFLMNYYEKKRTRGGDAYLLRIIPRRLSAELLIDHDPGENRFTSEEQRTLLQYYAYSEADNMYIMKKSLSEADEISLLRIFNMKNYHKRQVEKAKISEILERVDESPKRDIFFASMHIPEQHHFFNPPNLKHISGMHILESARQFAIACHHIYGKVPVQDVTFMLESLRCEFYQYARTNLPIKMRASLKDFKQNRSKIWRVTEFEITAYQQNREICKAIIKASILPLQLYRNLKSGQDANYEIEPRYLPEERFRNNLAIRYKKSNQVSRWVCQIVNYSRNGFVARSEGQEPPFQISEDSSLEFFMHFDSVGFIHGRCKSVMFKTDEEDNYLVEFSITEMDAIDRENLDEAISRFGRPLEDKELP